MASEEAAPLPRVLSVQSHVISGYVGNKCAIFPLQTLGFDVDPVMAVQFSNHTGFPSFTGTRMTGEQLLELVDGLDSNGLLAGYTHLLTGYIGSASLLEAVLTVVTRLRAVNPGLTYVCDPVMGDEGRLYVPADMVPLFRSALLPAASVITPNCFEAELLTGLIIVDDASAVAACDALHAQGPHTVVISSMPADDSSQLKVVASSRLAQREGRHSCLKLCVTRLPTYFTGTGDLLAALLLAWLHRTPDDLQLAVERAVSTLQAVIARTAAAAGGAGRGPGTREGSTAQTCRAGELRLIESRDCFVNPKLTVASEPL